MGKLQNLLKEYRRFPIMLISPPNKISNIHLVQYDNVSKLSEAERLYCEEVEKLAIMNHEYWLAHNREYTRKQKEYEKYLSSLPTKGNLEVEANYWSEFHRKFLEDHYLNHRSYNAEWYKKETELIILNIKAIYGKYKRILFSLK
ncbi:hypothetical protein SNEBB_008063 [Seison nebaliae]|nr:hypothetical protein SNEBB_008063 [Seison nebaliae]